jgi:hypothetical protein
MTDWKKLNNKRIQPTNKKVLAALYNVISDFKTVEKKFLDSGAEKEEVKNYLDAFKKLRDSGRIQDVQEKDIDSWGKKSFEDLKGFVDKLSEEKSKSKEKKLKKLEGAELVAENYGWKLYKIFNHKAARLYGSGTQWCITEEDGARWREYNRHSSFYFLISKTLPKDDPFYKIAVQYRDGRNTYWDATDDSHQRLPETLKVPNYSYVSFENSDTVSLRKKIKESGITPEVSDEILDTFGHRPIKYFPEKEFIAFELYDNLAEFAQNDTTLKWNVGILNGDEFLDDANAFLDRHMIIDTLDILEKKHAEIYDKLLTKLLNDSEFQEYMEENYFFEENTTIETLKERNKEDLNRRISVFTIEQHDELFSTFRSAADDACRSATEGDLWRRLKEGVENCEYILLGEDNNFLDSAFYTGVFLSDLNRMGSDIIEDINKEIKISVEQIDYVSPEDKDIVEQLVEYHLDEYLR